MTAIDILKFMGDLGARYKFGEINNAIEYFNKMIADERVIAIYGYDELCGILVFSLGKETDIEKFFKKSTWDYVSHDPLGNLVYIEKLICRNWDKELRIEFESEIVKKYPQIEGGVWHRAASWGDREVITKRRIYV